MVITFPSFLGFLLYLSSEASRVFIPLLTEELGGSSLAVGLVGGAYGFTYFVASLLFGRQADLRGRLYFVRLGLALSALCFAAQMAAGSVLSLAWLRAAVGFSLGVVTGALLVLAYENRGGVGKYSAWCAAGWIAGSFLAAVLQYYRLIFLLSALICLLAFLLSWRIKGEVLGAKMNHPSLWQVLTRHHRVYFPFFLRHLGASSVWIIFPLYLQHLGASKFWIGMAVMTNYLGQSLLMGVAERGDGFRLFRAGLGLSVLVFLLYPLLSSFYQVYPVQLLLAAAWSALYVGALSVLLREGEGRGTAAGALIGMINLCGALGPLVGGLLAYYWGYRAVMIFAALLSLVGLWWSWKH
ncbi:MFS transporter [Ammonifex thiophilus]|uniref:MFS transporter n=1 Tax=Ammonifex thiophilus TaxID=444093 RepID=A0A3D8P6E9_9THEO|nr:MFS transporter [Ammonifex thiophilus]RDV84177.1 MFS transporter [Ammonifex thiophilus]